MQWTRWVQFVLVHACMMAISREEQRGWMIEEDMCSMAEARADPCKLSQADEAVRIQQVIQKHILSEYRHSLSWSSLRDKLATGTPLFAALVAPVSSVGAIEQVR